MVAKAGVTRLAAAPAVPTTSVSRRVMRIRATRSSLEMVIETWSQGISHTRDCPGIRGSTYTDITLFIPACSTLPPIRYRNGRRANYADAVCAALCGMWRHTAACGGPRSELPPHFEVLCSLTASAFWNEANGRDRRTIARSCQAALGQANGGLWDRRSLAPVPPKGVCWSRAAGGECLIVGQTVF